MHAMNRLSILLVAILATLSVAAQPQIVAHRGFHQEGGAACNSIEALQRAQEAQFEWVEIDINLSTDGVPMAIHGMWHPNKFEGVHVQKSTKAEIQAHPLTNGEIVPTFEDVLLQAKKCKTTGLVLDIKSHDTPEIEKEVVTKVVALIKKHKLQDQTMYLVSHEYMLHTIKKLNKRGDNIILANSSYSPSWRVAVGSRVIGYPYFIWYKKGMYLADCSRLGVKTIAWTPNDEENIRKCVEMGFNYITTDKPDLARKIINEIYKK